jgi:molybdopterin-guanine dinucleotide biosynthesis protein A
MYHCYMKRAGFVLVGGKSSRMGRDKALLPYGRHTLVRHVAAQVSAAAGSVTLVGRPEKYRALGCAAIPDVYPDGGPVCGIQAALEASQAQWNLVVACDMPALTAGFLHTLLEAAESWPGDALIPVSPTGYPEPLCAVYRRTSLSLLTQAIQRNVRKVTEALAALRVVYRPVSEGFWFQNLNTPEDWARHRHE